MDGRFIRFSAKIIYDNYYNPLINGLVDDVDASIDAMNAAMDSAGIQDILDEMNRQAAEYVAEKEGK